MNQAGKIAMFDVSDPNQSKLLKALDLGQGSGPHSIALAEDEKRLVINDYFLNEDNFGKVHGEGDHKIHVARVMKDDLVLRSQILSRLQHRFPNRTSPPTWDCDQVEAESG
jgi:hypothetical protein